MVAALISAGLAFVVVFVVVLISQKNPILGPLLAALPIQFSCELFGLLLSGKDIDPFLVATTKAWLTGAFSITVFFRAVLFCATGCCLWCFCRSYFGQLLVHFKGVIDA